MLQKFAKKVFGSRNQRLLHRYTRLVQRINALEASYRALDDQALQRKTPDFRQRIKNGDTLEKLLPEAFAAVREAARRTLNLRHFDVQLIGGMVYLHLLLYSHVTSILFA